MPEVLPWISSILWSLGLHCGGQRGKDVCLQLTDILILETNLWILSWWSWRKSTLSDSDSLDFKWAFWISPGPTFNWGPWTVGSVSWQGCLSCSPSYHTIETVSERQPWHLTYQWGLGYNQALLKHLAVKCCFPHKGGMSCEPWLGRITRVSSKVGLHVYGLVNYKADGKVISLPFLTSYSVPSFSRESWDPYISSQDTVSNAGLSHSLWPSDYPVSIWPFPDIGDKP